VICIRMINIPMFVQRQVVTIGYSEGEPKGPPFFGWGAFGVEFVSYPIHCATITGDLSRCVSIFTEPIYFQTMPAGSPLLVLT